MADFNLVMPKLGESVQEATIIKWLVKPGDMIQEDDSLLEIATDKVDSEIPSPVAGKILKVLFPENALVPVGEVIAVINTEGTGTVEESPAAASAKPESGKADKNHGEVEKNAGAAEAEVEAGKGANHVKKDEVEKVSQVAEPRQKEPSETFSGRFYSPLVKSIAKKENITESELNSIPGHGTDGRLRKTDVLQYLEKRSKEPASSARQEPVRQESQGRNRQKGPNLQK